MCKHKSLIVIIIINCTCLITKPSFANIGFVKIKNVSFYEDKTKFLTIKDAVNLNYKTTSLTPNFGLSTSVYWFKITIENNSDDSNLLFQILNSTISSLELYKPENGKLTSTKLGEYIPFSSRLFKSSTPIFKVYIPRNNARTFFLKAYSNSVIQLPMSIGSEYDILYSISFDQYLFGIYIGIIFVMFFYNLFIYLTVQDNNYLFYVLYISVIGLTQACLKGYAGKYLWPENTWIIIHAQIIIIGLSGIVSLLFSSSFLNAKYNSPLFYNLCKVLIIADIIGIIFALLNFYILAQQLFQIVNGIESILIIVFGLIVYKKGYKPALFLNISWSFFLVGVIIYILKDVGILAYSTFTSNSILIGSAIEVTLLSFALADKINTYKKEKEELQAQALVTAQEKVESAKNQNNILEHKVEERTFELVETNKNLSKTLTDLKEAQTQLVEAEKMASLGQLTAGIAHEINNPINFVSANIEPLKRDVDLLVDAIQTMENVGLSEIPVSKKQQQIDEYKEEIDFDYLKLEIGQLLNGIHEGASRTAEIVKGLKIFARLDEDDLKKADINEGLASTLLVANNIIGKNIRVIRNFGQIPVIECFPGKLNQVFLNIISNAIYAIDEKFGKEPGGVLEITTACDEKYLLITIADNGTGMSEATKNKIFEPFFTTKNVGVGTGLGMSIVYNTIKKHHGEIYINSAEGEGTTFILKLHLIFDEYLLEDYQSEQHG